MDWGEASRNVCIEEDLHGPTEVVKEDSDGGDDDESMMEEIPDFRISPREALFLPGKIMCRTDIDAEDSESIVKYRSWRTGKARHQYEKASVYHNCLFFLKIFSIYWEFVVLFLP